MSEPVSMPEAEGRARRPRIAVMGEFSAGKSTLTNLLMGAPALPTRVTATQLPPVWLVHGPGACYGVDLDGARFEVDLDALDGVSPATTRYLSVERPADVLQLCDLIDFPGLSDPNMPADVWQRAAPLADGVLWCTHATQAWRQSEAAAWEEMPEALRARSLLLLTRMDRIADAKDRRRVLSRVVRETEGLFAGVYPVSLTRAIAAGEDRAAFEESGAQALLDALLELVMRLSRELGQARPNVAPGAVGSGSVWPGTQRPGTQRPGTQRPGPQWPGTERRGTEGRGSEGRGSEHPGMEGPEREDAFEDGPDTGRPVAAGPVTTRVAAGAATGTTAGPPRVVPRRVRPMGGAGRTPRPGRETGEGATLGLPR